MRSDKLQKHSHIHNSLNHKSKKKKQVNSRDVWDMFRNTTKKATNYKKLLHLINKIKVKKNRSCNLVITCLFYVSQDMSKKSG